jgi:MSHA biogenesis protein MshN
MSLINQMLKDLESRRASGDLAQHAVGGMGAAARHKNRKQNVLLLGLLLVIAVLASISGYLLWQERQTLTAQQVAKPVSATAVAQVKPKTVLVTEPVVSQPMPSQSQPRQPLVTKEPASAATVRETPAGMTRPEAEEPTPAQNDDKESLPVTSRKSSSTRIKKHLRPQSREQLAEQQYQKGYALLQRGDRKGAESVWRKALRIDANHTSSRESLAILYLSQSRRIEAAEQLQKGLAFDPGNNKLALLYARMQLDAEDSKGAVATLEKAMQTQPQTADFYAFTAAVYQRMGDFEKSIAAYQAALKKQSKQSVWWMGLGISLEGAGKTREALTAYTEAKKSGHLAFKLKQYVEGRIKVLE